MIDLPSFYGDPATGKSATADVRRILSDFLDKKVDGVILDLRRNGGGLLNEARSMTDLFIDKGPVVQVKDSAGVVKKQDGPDKGAVYNGPLVVLTSRFSASASEIVAGALQDYGRALIVGDTSTYGKGTVQTVIDLGDQIRAEKPLKLGALKLTIQQFYRPDGASTQAEGVRSDVVVPSLTEHLASVEKDSEHALKFDKVKAADHEHLNMVSDQIKTVLKERSANRVKQSKDFDKLAKDVELFKARKARKSVPLNEEELREQLKKDDADKIDKKVEELTPSDTPSDETAYKFKHNFLNDEVLHIMEDYLQGKKLLANK